MKVRWVASAVALLAAAAFAARGCEGPPRPRRAALPERPVLPPPPEPEPEPLPSVPAPLAPPPPVVRRAPEPPPPTPAPAPLPAAKPGTLIGTVRVAGAVPARRPVRMDADPRCAARHETPLMSDEMVVDREGRVRWAFVYVKRGLNDRRFPPPSTPALLDQVGCRYQPHVLGVQVDQPLVVRNSDGFLHNVNVLSLHNRERSFSQVQLGAEETLRFADDEVMIPFRCAVHPWMRAWVGVLDHPFFAVTDELGGYAIPGLPPGRYELAVWHERLAPESREFEVPESGQVLADFLLRLKSDSR